MTVGDYLLRARREVTEQRLAREWRNRDKMRATSPSAAAFRDLTEEERANRQKLNASVLRACERMLKTDQSRMSHIFLLDLQKQIVLTRCRQGFPFQVWERFWRLCEVNNLPQVGRPGSEPPAGTATQPPPSIAAMGVPIR